MDEASAPPGRNLPSFVKLMDEPRFDGSLINGWLDCWHVDPTGIAEIDYATGAINLAAALDIRPVYNGGAVFNTLHSMMVHDRFGEMERGFIEALARRAVAGRMCAMGLPTDATQEEVSDAEDTIECLLQFWREQRYWQDAAGYLTDCLINRRGLWTVVAMHAFSTAAYNGSMN